MKSKWLRVMSFVCACAMLFTANAFALPAGDNASEEQSGTSVNVDVDDEAAETGSTGRLDADIFVMHIV